MPHVPRRFPFLAAGGLAVLMLAACSFGPPATQSGTSTALTRIVLGWSGGPATSQAVTWRTAATATAPTVQLIEGDPARASATGSRSIAARSRTVRLDDGRIVTHYRADMIGLKPGTRYAYRVGDGKGASAWHGFTTARAEPEPFRFLYLGDAQNGLGRQWPALVSAARRAVPDARLIVHAGDLLDQGYDDGLWGDWVAGLGAFAASVPHVPAPGNHDLHRSPSRDASGRVFEASALWTAHFALPSGGPASLPELAGQNYALDYQGVRFIVLDSNALANTDYVPEQRDRVRRDQLAWLRQILSAPRQRWTIVVHHHPIYAVAKGRDYEELRNALVPLYDEFQVDLVLNGHDHVYARTHKLRAGRVVDPAQPGTIYAIAVSGSKMNAVMDRRAPLMARLQEDTQTWQTVSVAPDRLTYESHALDGTLVDAFDLVKPAGAGSTYLNRSPVAPGPR